MDRFKRTKVREIPLNDRMQSFDEIVKGYTEEEARLEASRCLNCKVPGCRKGCPISQEIPAFLQELKEGNHKKAIDIVRKRSALPSVCGRVCPQEKQCEGNCILGKKGEAIAIGLLERYVADYARENNLNPLEREEKKEEKVAVIGSGPAGIGCARELAKKGYNVTLFEESAEVGGIMYYGIPKFRLPKDTALKGEIDILKELGVEIKTNTSLGDKISIESLKEEFQAIFIGIGASVAKTMRIKGMDLDGVYLGNDFLKRFHQEEDNELIKSGDKVIVIGGGNVAMDVARVSKRLHGDVTIVYRRSEKELPARIDEIHSAKLEGVNFNLLTNPIEVIKGENNKARGIKCIKMKLGEPDESGRRAPEEIKGSEFTIDCDKVIMALGSEPDARVLSESEDLNLDYGKYPQVDDNTFETSIKGVFAGGDVVTGPETVVNAMKAGIIAAAAIDNYLKGTK